MPPQRRDGQQDRADRRSTAATTRLGSSWCCRSMTVSSTPAAGQEEEGGQLPDEGRTGSAVEREQERRPELDDGRRTAHGPTRRDSRLRGDPRATSAAAARVDQGTATGPDAVDRQADATRGRPRRHDAAMAGAVPVTARVDGRRARRPPSQRPMPRSGNRRVRTRGSPARPAARPSSAHTPSVRSTDHLSRKIRTRGDQGDASATGRSVVRSGSSRCEQAPVDVAGLGEQRVHGEVDGQVGDDARRRRR